MRNDSVIPWITLEMLAPDVMSVASVGHAPRDFAGWQRVLQRQLSKTPAIYDGLTTAGIVDAVWCARTSARERDLSVATKEGPYSARIRPVLGPAGDVHAVQLWLGPSSEPTPEPPAAVGAIWDLESQTIAVPSGLARLAGTSAEEYVPRMSIAELFHRISGFDRHAEVLDLLYEPSPGGRLQFDATLVGYGQRSGRWRFTVRSRDDERGRGAWWLIEDVSDGEIPPPYPALESIGLREALRRAGTSLALVALEHACISHWLTDPAPWIRWDYLYRPGDVFHPEDRERLVAAGERVRLGETVGVTVRTLDYGGWYMPTSMLVFPYPGFSTRPLAIAQFVRIADDAPNPEARPAAHHPAGCTGPIGYDEQLRHHLAGRMSRRALC